MKSKIIMIVILLVSMFIVHWLVGSDTFILDTTRMTHVFGGVLFLSVVWFLNLEFLEYKKNYPNWKLGHSDNKILKKAVFCYEFGIDIAFYTGVQMLYMQDRLIEAYTLQSLELGLGVWIGTLFFMFRGLTTRHMIRKEKPKEIILLKNTPLKIQWALSVMVLSLMVLGAHI